jgi:aminocarboxymuconate-semialdehyde decarboxylase
MGAQTNKISEAPSSFLRRVYVDTANSSLHNHLANIELMGPDHVLFGTDSPPLATPLEDAIGSVRALSLSEPETQGILGANAQRLFGL